MLAAIALTTVGACVDGPGSEQPVPGADRELFVETVQPVLEASCAQSSCHGTDVRPLEVFSEDDHRAVGPDGEQQEGPITDEELTANFRRAQAFLIDVDAAMDSLLLRKPLAVAVGGVLHATGPVYDSTEDHEFLALFDWVEDAVEGAP